MQYTRVSSAVAPGYPASWVSLAQLLYDFPELGDVDQMMKYLDNGRAADQPRAELLLGKLYYEGKWVPADAKAAEAHFEKAVGKEVAADYYLGQIYRRGYLGKVYPQKALDHLLTAARSARTAVTGTGWPRACCPMPKAVGQGRLADPASGADRAGKYHQKSE